MKKILFLAAFGLLLAGCSKGGDAAKVKDNGLPKADSARQVAKGGIAYVEVDSLATQYQYCIDQQKVLQDKSNSFEAALKNEATALQNAYASFQKKLQEGGFASEQEARNAQAAIERQQQTAAQHEQQYSEQLAKLTTDYQKELKKRLSDYLAEYNKDGRFEVILSNSDASMTVLYATEGRDITADVIAGLNKLYKPEESK